MPKQKTWKNPNKQALVTGHKKFDQQLTAISSGQVLGGTQTSFFVRPHNEVVGPMGLTYQPGHLQEFDLQHFKPGMPWYVLGYVKAATKEQSLLVHEFYTYRASRGRTIIGYLLVRFVDGQTPKIVAGFCTTERASGYRVLDAVAPYVADLDEGEEVPYQYRPR